MKYSIQKKYYFPAFTLVELIVVITILAILWTVAFISFQWYTKDTRETVRISDIQNIKKWYGLFDAKYRLGFRTKNWVL